MNLLFSADDCWNIVFKNQLVFRAAPDMRRFKEKTLGGAVIMGRRTLESLPGGRALKGRTNIVLTRAPSRVNTSQADAGDARILLCRNLVELAKCLADSGHAPDRTWVIGGAQIIRLLAPYCREAHVTRFLATAAAADCRTDDLDKSPDWLLAEEGEIVEWEGLRFRYCRYVNTGCSDSVDFIAGFADKPLDESAAI